MAAGGAQQTRVMLLPRAKQDGLVRLSVLSSKRHCDPGKTLWYYPKMLPVIDRHGKSPSSRMYRSANFWYLKSADDSF